MNDVVLEVKNLTKRYGTFSAVDGISFAVKRGEILGLLGPNGAGKTTTIHMLLGTTTLTSGEIEYFGKDFLKHRSELLESVNYASAYDNLPHRLTVWENLQVYARLYGVSDRQKRIEILLKEFDIEELKNKQVLSLSAGQKTRLSLCKAFINYPQVILLDEPTSSLDPDIAIRVRQFILKQQRKFGVAVLFTSHNMAEVTEVCDRVIFLQAGRIVAEDTPEGLAKKIKYTTLELLVGDGLKRTVAFAKAHQLDHEVEGRMIKIKIEEQGVAEFLAKLAEEKIAYSEISIEKPTLEDFFLEMSSAKQRGKKI